jgi:hypothetical protein
MAEMIRVPAMTEEQQRVLRLLSPQEKLEILVNAALGRRETIRHATDHTRNQVDFNGTTYEVYPLDHIDQACDAMANGRQVLVRRECVSCHYDMFDSPVRRYQWSDACANCTTAFEEQLRSEEESASAAADTFHDERDQDYYNQE